MVAAAVADVHPCVCAGKVCGSGAVWDWYLVSKRNLTPALRLTRQREGARLEGSPRGYHPDPEPGRVWGVLGVQQFGSVVCTTLGLTVYYPCTTLLAVLTLPAEVCPSTTTSQQSREVA